MPISHKGAFAQFQRQKFALATAAVGTLDLAIPANIVQICTVGDLGALLTSFKATPRETVTATALYLFATIDNGTNFFLVKSVVMAAHTVAGTTAVPSTDFGFTDADNKRLGDLDGGADGVELWVGVGVSFNITFEANFTDY